MDRATWRRRQGRGGVAVGLIAPAGALAFLMGGVATRTYCATATCFPEPTVDWVAWQEATHAALTGPLSVVWLLYVSVVVVGIGLAVVAYIVGRLLTTGSRVRVAGRPAWWWVDLAALVALAVFVVSFAAFGAEYTWVNNALE